MLGIWSVTVVKNRALLIWPVPFKYVQDEKGRESSVGFSFLTSYLHGEYPLRSENSQPNGWVNISGVFKKQKQSLKRLSHPSNPLTARYLKIFRLEHTTKSDLKKHYLEAESMYFSPQRIYPVSSYLNWRNIRH